MANKSESNGPKTATYVLRKGYTHNAFKGEGDDRRRHMFVGGEEGNDRVELTEAQAKAFGDRFDSLKELQARAKVHEEMEKGEEPSEGAGTITNTDVKSEDTTKKPDPVPPVGENKPVPADNVPPQTGQTSDPVNAPKGAEAKK